MSTLRDQVPEKREVAIGIVPLTDCASVVMAQELGLFARHGLQVKLSKEASWAALRDKLGLGLLDAAHALYGLVYGLHLGIGGPRQDMAVLMELNRNGQAITLSHALARAGAVDGAGLARLVHAGRHGITLAQTFPTGTHALWLYYWLAAFGIHPLRQVRCITVPPQQMVAQLAGGALDGFCVGEPWGARAVAAGLGFTVITSQAIWRDHPEKVLGCTRAFVQAYPNTARAMVMAVLEASRYVDDPANVEHVAAVLGRPAWVDAAPELIAGRLGGDYTDGRGARWHDPHGLKFFDGGAVNFPAAAHGMWFLSQFSRWGLAEGPIDYAGIANRISCTALYAEAAAALGIPVIDPGLAPVEFFDGRIWDPSRPEDYVRGFASAS